MTIPRLTSRTCQVFRLAWRAYRLLRRGDPDLQLLDLSVERVDGLDARRLLQRADPAVEGANRLVEVGGGDPQGDVVMELRQDGDDATGGRPQRPAGRRPGGRVRRILYI